MTSKHTSQAGNKRSSLARKLAYGFAAAGTIATVVAASVSYFTARTALEETAFAKMLNSRSVLQSDVENFFGNTQRDVVTLAESPASVAALTELRDARGKLKAELEAAGALDAARFGEIRTRQREFYQTVLLPNLEKVRGTDPGSVESYIPGTDETAILQYIYTVANPAAIGDKFEGASAAEIATYSTVPAELRTAIAGSTYAKAHDKHHIGITDYRKRFGFYDVFLCDADGTVVYTNFKELDFGTNLKFGPDKDTGLAKAFTAALELPPGQASITDIGLYPKSYDAPAIFSASAIREGGKIIGALVVQLPTDQIERTVTFGGQHEKLGLGKTGESYIVGADRKLRTNSRFTNSLPSESKRRTLSSNGKTLGETSSNALTVSHQSVVQALAGQQGEMITPDYRGERVLSSYSKLNISGLDWALLVEQDESEAQAASFRLLQITLGVGTAVVALVVGFGVFLARRLTRPIVALDQTMTRVASGDTAARSPVISNDETATLAETFNSMIAERNAVQEKLYEENVRLQANIQDLLIVVSDASDGNLGVRAKVTEGALGNVADAMNLMFENVGDLIANAKTASSRVSLSANLIAKVAADVQTGAERQASQIGETTTGINELNGQSQSVLLACQAANDAASGTKTAAQEGSEAMRELMSGMENIRENVQANSKKIKRLGDRSMEIAAMVKGIGDISAQTDMLAFNASIEASRAGDAGRGFSVVAEQVRSLAEKTKMLTEQIDALVRATQAETAEAVMQMETQTQIVEKGARSAEAAGVTLNGIVSASGQSAEAVGRISAAATLQAARTREIKLAIDEIGQIVGETQQKVGTTRATSDELTALSTDLDRQLSQFTVAQV